MSPPRAAAKPPARILQLKLQLRDLEPPIWRRVLVRADRTFARLHLIFQEVMGWENYHLHVFEIDGRRIGVADPDGELDDEDGRKLRLDRVLIDRGTVFTYEYDFGDGWEHEVELEEFLPPDPRLRYPLCIGGARACPPEDAGGVSGYQELLESLAVPTHPDHDQHLTWVGGHFDPEGFDANRVNRALHRLR